MDKKQYLIKVLEQLESVRNLAKWLKVLVEMWNLDDDLLGVLTQAVEWAIHTTKDELRKQKLQKSLIVLWKMKHMEEMSRLNDEKDLRELDHLIESM